MRIEKKILMAAACGLVGGAAGVAQAQPYVINISGATLLENFVKSKSSTNDWIDVNANGISGQLGSIDLDQLAPNGLDPFPAGAWWCVQYRVVGSVNGIVELANYADTFVNSGSDGPELSRTTASLAYYNGNSGLYINAGTLVVPPANAGNPGGAPVTSSLVPDGNGGFAAFRNSNGTFSGGGIRIDIAPSDVPGRWAVRSSGETAVGATPGTNGYGNNLNLSRNNQGGLGGMDSRLPAFSGRNFNTSSPDANTLFDNDLAFAPIAYITNFGTGLQQINMSDLQHLYTAGRLRSGENLMAVTRDVGSGTRNGAMNSIGIDPSFGVGDNVGGAAGAPSNSQAEDRLGAMYVPNNKNGSSNLERSVVNHRLAIGYSGAERGVTGSSPASWLTSNSLECLAVVHDIGLYTGTLPYRPDIASVCDGNYNIGGPAVLVSRGDPRNQNELGGVLGNTNPRMPNPQAAAYLNNIRISIADFVNPPPPPALPDFDFQPGQFLARTLILPPALHAVHSISTPTLMIDNTGNITPSLDAYTRANNALANARYDAFNTGVAGKVPNRSTGVVYSDGVAGGTNYIDMTGAPISYASNLSLRNKIAGDFNGNGARDAGDVVEMIKAWRHRNAGPVWIPATGTGAIAGAPGSDAIIEVLGDFNGDGSFNARDVRYWGDGLHLVGGSLNRKLGFTAIDSDLGGNFFGTTKSTGNAHNSGDSRADVIGDSGNIARGFAPVGADGAIDARDLLYIRSQFLGNSSISGGEANWSDLAEATTFDLTCDLTGDLKVNAADVTEFYAILGTCPPDFNLDGSIDFFDYDDFVAEFEASGPLSDFNSDGSVDFFDYDDFVGAFESPC